MAGGQPSRLVGSGEPHHGAGLEARQVSGLHGVLAAAASELGATKGRHLGGPLSSHFPLLFFV
jgi:hypothetical protein